VALALRRQRQSTTCPASPARRSRILHRAVWPCRRGATAPVSASAFHVGSQLPRAKTGVGAGMGVGRRRRSRNSAFRSISRCRRAGFPVSYPPDMKPPAAQLGGYIGGAIRGWDAAGAAGAGVKLWAEPGRAARRGRRSGRSGQVQVRRGGDNALRQWMGVVRNLSDCQALGFPLSGTRVRARPSGDAREWLANSARGSGRTCDSAEPALRGQFQRPPEHGGGEAIGVEIGQLWPYGGLSGATGSNGLRPRRGSSRSRTADARDAGGRVSRPELSA